MPSLVLPPAWRCSSCLRRAFSTAPPKRAVGPEHPAYIEVVEPPQQTISYKPYVKGVLPIPRDIFAGAGRGKDKASHEWIQAATKRPKRERTPTKGSRQEWKAKMSEARRRNLEEGLKGLRHRQDKSAQQLAATEAARAATSIRLRRAPEPMAERLGRPTHGLDLKSLLRGGQLPDPTRDARLAHKRANVDRVNAEKQRERLFHLNKLATHARTFIVNQQQLDEAIDGAFGTPENPISFTNSPDAISAETQSVWAMGKPQTIQEKLNSSQQIPGSIVSQTNESFAQASVERIRKIAEELTGGKMA